MVTQKLVRHVTASWTWGQPNANSEAQSTKIQSTKIYKKPHKCPQRATQEVHLQVWVHLDIIGLQQRAMEPKTKQPIPTCPRREYIFTGFGLSYSHTSEAGSFPPLPIHHIQNAFPLLGKFPLLVSSQYNDLGSGTGSIRWSGNVWGGQYFINKQMLLKTSASWHITSLPLY